MLGKQELLAKGYFDDIDIAMMIHTNPPASARHARQSLTLRTARSSSKFALLGGPPMLAERRSWGINALNAAMIAMNAMAAHRETFGKGIRSAFVRSLERAVTQSVLFRPRSRWRPLCAVARSKRSRR
jgi:metal-dependent amidase/aminoacylase/carboxypeptidase family protein